MAQYVSNLKIINKRRKLEILKTEIKYHLFFCIKSFFTILVKEKIIN